MTKYFVQTWDETSRISDGDEPEFTSRHAANAHVRSQSAKSENAGLRFRVRKVEENDDESWA